MNEQPKKIDLTTDDSMGRMEGEARTGRVRADKKPTKLKASPELLEVLSRLHTWARDERDYIRNEETEETAYELLVIILSDLADLTQELYGRMHG